MSECTNPEYCSTQNCNYSINNKFTLKRHSTDECRCTDNKQNIKNIRSYNKDKAYTDFGTDKYVNNVNNISFYKSSFLKNTSYVYSYSGPRVHLCNNMKNGECDVLSEYVSSEQACVKLNNEKVGVTLYE